MMPPHAVSYAGSVVEEESNWIYQSSQDDQLLYLPNIRKLAQAIELPDLAGLCDPNDQR